MQAAVERDTAHSDDEEEEEVIKISRYIAADFHELDRDSVEELCKLLDVRASKVKQWCERELIRKHSTTGLIDMKRLMNVVDGGEDAKKLQRFVKKQEDENKAAMVSGGQSQHYCYDHARHYHHHSPREFVVSYRRSGLRKSPAIPIQTV